MSQAHNWTVAENFPEFAKDFAQLCFRYDINGIREYLVVANIKGDATRMLFASDNSEINKQEAYEKWYEIENLIYAT